MAALVNSTIGIVNYVDGLLGVTSAAETHNVDACIANGLTGCNDIGRYILAGTASTLYHDVASYMAELVNQHACTDDGIIINHHFTCQLGSIADDAAVATTQS